MVRLRGVAVRTHIAMVEQTPHFALFIITQPLQRGRRRAMTDPPGLGSGSGEVRVMILVRGSSRVGKGCCS